MTDLFSATDVQEVVDSLSMTHYGVKGMQWDQKKTQDQPTEKDQENYDNALRQVKAKTKGGGKFTESDDRRLLRLNYKKSNAKERRKLTFNQNNWKNSKKLKNTIAKKLAKTGNYTEAMRIRKFDQDSE